jgi:hypothetical protein
MRKWEEDELLPLNSFFPVKRPLYKDLCNYNIVPASSGMRNILERFILLVYIVGNVDPPSVHFST